MSERVDVYIDVDGVINAVGLSAPRDAGWDRWEVTRCEGFPIWYAPELVDRLNTLAALPQVDMHWLTTWEDRATKALSPALGIDGGDWPVLGAEQHYSRDLNYGWWKHHALADYFPPRDRRAVWIDDDIAFDRSAQEWVARFGDRLLIVSPQSRRGITRDEMERIEAFVTTHPTRVAATADAPGSVAGEAGA